MKIEKDKVVQITYQMSDLEENTLEGSTEGMPMAYLHGHNGLLSGLEQAMEGHIAGEEFTVTLSPEQAYGEIVENSEKKIPMKHLQGAKKWKKGMVAVVHTEEGRRQVTVVKPGKFMVVVDFNHPFAGKTLVFKVKVVDVRDATLEEITHGHAHGVGGHHH